MLEVLLEVTTMLRNFVEAGQPFYSDMRIQNPEFRIQTDFKASLLSTPPHDRTIWCKVCDHHRDNSILLELSGACCASYKKSSTRIKDAGIAIRHLRGYVASILQGPEMGRGVELVSTAVSYTHLRAHET